MRSSPDQPGAGAALVTTELARPKVNLTLHVGAPKSNRRHDLRSLVVFPDVEACDRVILARSEGLRFRTHGPTAAQIDVAADDNLVLRAVRGLATKTGRAPDLDITLEKHLPVAAGVGGGSCDAGAALRGLERLWGLKPGSNMDIARTLGGDGPVAYHSHTAIMAGEGERILALSGVDAPPIVLVNPGIACPTGPVFQSFDRRGVFQPLGEGCARPGASELISWVHEGRNDLEPSAVELFPVIGGVLSALRVTEGVRIARMSGSGATCFGVFDNVIAADQAATQLRQSHPDWWVSGPRIAET